MHFPIAVFDNNRFVSPSSDDEKLKVISELPKLFKSLITKGRPGQFYPNFYAVVIPRFRILFSEFARQGSTLLSTRIAEKIVGYSREKEKSEIPVKTVLTENENVHYSTLVDMYCLASIEKYNLPKRNTHPLPNKNFNSTCWKN